MSYSASSTAKKSDLVPLWTYNRLDHVIDAMSRAHKSGDPSAFTLMTSQEAEQGHGNNEVPGDATWWKDDTSRRLLTGPTPQIFSRLQEEWENHARIWDNSGIGNHIIAVEDAIYERIRDTQKAPMLVIFFGLGSLQDQNNWPNSFLAHLTMERILAIIRRMLPTSEVQVVFEDTSYTGADNAFLTWTFNRDLGLGNLIATVATVTNNCSALKALREDSPSWSNILYVTCRSRNPYRQMLADITLERIKLGEDYPRMVICVPANDNDDDNGARNHTSKKVEEWLNHYPEKLMIMPERHELLGQLCLFTRPPQR